MELAQAGYFVVINFKSNETAAQETLNLVRYAGGDGEICPFDVADHAQTIEAVKAITGAINIFRCWSITPESRPMVFSCCWAKRNGTASLTPA